MGKLFLKVLLIHLKLNYNSIPNKSEEYIQDKNKLKRKKVNFSNKKLPFQKKRKKKFLI